MSIFQERRFWRRVLRSRAVILFVSVILITLFFKTSVRLLELKSINKSVLETEKEIASLNTEINTLEEKINNTKEGIGIEKEIRERFNVKKEGEHTIIIVEPKEQEKEIKKEINKGLLERIKDFIGLK